MSHRVYVSIGSRDHPPRVDSDGLRAVSSARKIERGNGAVLGPDESVSQKVYVKQGTDDCSWRVDAREKKPLNSPGTSNVVRSPFLVRRKP